MFDFENIELPNSGIRSRIGKFIQKISQKTEEINKKKTVKIYFFIAFTKKKKKNPRKLQDGKMILQKKEIKL